MSSSNTNNETTVINVENDATTISNEQNQLIQEEEVEENHQATTATAAIPELLNSFYRTMSSLNYLVSTKEFAAIFLEIYLLHMIGSCFIGVYYLFPVMYPIFSWLLAFIGLLDSYKLLIPCMLTAACEMIYAIICVTFLISFHVRDNEFLLNEFLFFFWPETAKKFDKVSRDDYYFVMCLIYCSTSIVMGYVVISILKVRITRMRVKAVKEQRVKYNKEISEINKEKGLVLVETQLLQDHNRILQDQSRILQNQSRVIQDQDRVLQDQRQILQDQASTIRTLREENRQNQIQIQAQNQQLQALTLNAQHEQSQNPFASLLAEYPPPPSYHSERVLLAPPQNGLPPPTYSMLERIPSTIASQQSINNQSSSNTAVPEINDSNGTS